jgi:hypothetical protein
LSRLIDFLDNLATDGYIVLMQAFEMTEALARASRKWVLYLSHSAGPEEELSSAVLGVSREDLLDLIDGRIWLTFDTEATAFAVFGGVVGDDGPTKTNPYNGKCRVYAFLAGPEGGITENT